MECLWSSLRLLQGEGTALSVVWHRCWSGQEPRDELARVFGAPVTAQGVQPAVWGCCEKPCCCVLQCEIAVARRSEQIEAK